MPWEYHHPKFLIRTPNLSNNFRLSSLHLRHLKTRLSSSLGQPHTHSTHRSKHHFFQSHFQVGSRPLSYPVMRRWKEQPSKPPATHQPWTFPHAHLSSFIHSSITKKWHQLWTDQNKLAIIKPTPIPWSSSIFKSYRLEKIVTCLRIGHTRPTHSHLISQLFPLTCNFCNTDNPLTITHLFFCTYLVTTRKAHQVPNNPVQVLANDPSQLNNTFSFLQVIKLLHKI